MNRNEGVYYDLFSTPLNMDTGFFFLAELREIVLVVCGTVVAVLAVIGLFVLYAR